MAPTYSSFIPAEDKDNINIIKIANGITYEIQTAFSPIELLSSTKTFSPGSKSPKGGTGTVISLTDSSETPQAPFAWQPAQAVLHTISTVTLSLCTSRTIPS